MDPLSITAAAIAILQVSSVVVKYCYNYRNDVKTARRDASRIIDEVRSLEKVLERLVEIVDEEAAAAPDGKTEKLSTVEMLAESDGPLRMIEKELLRLKEKLTPPKSRWESIRKDLKWPMEQRDLEKTIESIGKIKATLNLALSTDQRTLTRALKHEIGTLKASFYSAKSDETRERIYKWLGATDSTFDNDQAQKKRQPLTGYWLINSPEFEKWIETRDSFLWLYGLPGCGKTILCSTVIEKVKSYCISTDGAALAYYFFDFNDGSKRQYRTMLCALIKLFSVQHKECPGSLKKLHHYYSTKGQIPPDDVLAKCLRDIMEPFSQCFIIIDGLDESTEREKIFQFLEQTIRWELHSLHILIFSRREKDIEDALVPLATDQVCISSEVIDEDIKIYVKERLKVDPKLKKWPAKVQEEIENSLCSEAHGMFRWAACQLDTISSCVRLGPLRNALKKLPQTLDETYNRILSNIPEEYHEDTYKVLQWLCFSARPLMISEVCEILAVDPQGDPRFSSEQRLLEPLALLSLCSSLIIIDPPGPDDLEETVKLAHLSVRDYLISEKIKSSRVSHFHMNKLSAHRSITEVCLSYLLNFDEENDPLTEEDLPEYPLIDYSARYWALHCSRVQNEEPSDLVNELGEEFMRSDSIAFVTWLRVHDPESPFKRRDFRRSESQLREPLFYAAFYGLEQLVDLLVDRTAKIGDEKNGIAPALEIAASKGHKNIVSKLIDSEIGDVPHSVDTSLQLASLSGLFDLVKFLIEKNASVNAEDVKYGTAIQAACSSEKDNKLVINTLLAKGANVNTECGYFANPLQAAAFNGKDAEVRMLLKAGADVNAYGGCYASALQAACGQGHAKTVLTLLNAGADINKQHRMKSFDEVSRDSLVSLKDEDDGIHGTALQAASMNGHEDVIKVLLDHGADINAPGIFFGTALGVAASYGKENIVRLLLDRGADINQQGGEGSFQGATPLKAACMKHHASIAKILLERGADVNVPCGNFSNALQATAWNGNDPIVRILLEHGAKVDAASGDYLSVLDAAIRGHRPETVGLLLDAGADPKALCKHGTAIEAAVYEGHQPTVELLLKRGITHGNLTLPIEDYAKAAKDLISAQQSSLAAHPGDAHNTLFQAWKASDSNLASKIQSNTQASRDALRWAAANDELAFLKYLLASDSLLSIEILDWHLKTPLHSAAESGSEEALTYLLEQGAKTDLQDRYGETALHYAAENGHLACVKALVSWGADWTIRDNPIRWGRTPIKCARDEDRRDVADYLGSLRLDWD